MSYFDNAPTEILGGRFLHSGIALLACAAESLNKVCALCRQYGNAIEQCSKSGSSSTQNGALLLCVVGGKMSEGINFGDGLGRSGRSSLAVLQVDSSKSASLPTCLDLDVQTCPFWGRVHEKSFTAQPSGSGSAFVDASCLLNLASAAAAMKYPASTLVHMLTGTHSRASLTKHIKDRSCMLQVCGCDGHAISQPHRS